jgi:hypothetical protein
MFRLVPSLLEVQVVSNVVFLVWSDETNCHVEFSPSFLLDPEWGVSESCFFFPQTSVKWVQDCDIDRQCFA